MNESCLAMKDIVTFKKQELSWDEKVSLCNHWKGSGLSKTRFCKRHQLVFSTFCGWCDRLWPKKRNNQLCQVAVVDAPNEKSRNSLMMHVELNFPNQVSAKIDLSGHQVFGLIKELIHATTASR